MGVAHLAAAEGAGLCSSQPAIPPPPELVPPTARCRSSTTCLVAGITENGWKERDEALNEEVREREETSCRCHHVNRTRTNVARGFRSSLVYTDGSHETAASRR